MLLTVVNIIPIMLLRELMYLNQANKLGNNASTVICILEISVFATALAILNQTIFIVPLSFHVNSGRVS
jgi:hypothetical protein